MERTREKGLSIGPTASKAGPARDLPHLGSFQELTEFLTHAHIQHKAWDNVDSLCLITDFKEFK